MCGVCASHVCGVRCGRMRDILCFKDGYAVCTQLALVMRVKMVARLLGVDKQISGILGVVVLVFLRYPTCSRSQANDGNKTE